MVPQSPVTRMTRSSQTRHSDPAETQDAGLGPGSFGKQRRKQTDSALAQDLRQMSVSRRESLPTRWGRIAATFTLFSIDVSMIRIRNITTIRHEDMRKSRWPHWPTRIHMNAQTQRHLGNKSPGWSGSNVKRPTVCSRMCQIARHAFSLVCQLLPPNTKFSPDWWECHSFCRCLVGARVLDKLNVALMVALEERSGTTVIRFHHLGTS